jgi:hypothetical protein
MAPLRRSVVWWPPVEQRERGMADVIYLATGGGAFLLFAALAAGLKRI